MNHGRVPLAFGGSDKLLLSFEVEVPNPESPLVPIVVTYYEVAQVEFTSDGEISFTTEGNFTIPSGTSPGTLYNSPENLTPQITLDNRIAFLDNCYLSFFDSTGGFLNRVDLIDTESTDGGVRDHYYVSLKVGMKGLFITNKGIYNQFGHSLFNFRNNGISIYGDGKSFMNSKGNLILRTRQNAEYGHSDKFQQWNRAYRTKGLPEPNAIPQPLVHSVKQRAGTNILDIDFEIVDPDDDTAKVGILANVAQPDSENSEDSGLSGNNIEFGNENIFYGGDYPMIIPSSWVEGTDAKIGSSISTNQVHRVSWYVKGDWNQLYGELKIGIFAQDARREKPVDVHFLTLPVGNSTLTISRSEITKGFKNYILYKLSVGELKFGTRNVGLPLAEEE